MNTHRFLILAAALLIPLPAWAGQLVYVAGGNKVTVFGLDDATGKLTPVQSLDLPGAGPMVATPDRKRLYAKAKGKASANAIATLDVAGDGTLTVAHTAGVNLAPGYLCLDKTQDYLAGNHYGPGKATVWKLDAGVYRGETAQEITLEKRAHSAVFSPNNRFLLVPATGPNKVFQMSFDSSTGRATPNSPPHADGPAGEDAARQPRHLVFHPTLPVAYTTNEREKPGVGMWSWNADAGTLKTVQNLVSTPPGFKGTITTADLHVTPDGRYLYASNRDLTDRKAKTGNSSIAAFKLDAGTGRMTMIGTFPCEHIPRSICLDKTGRYLFAAGQMEDALGAYRIDPATGKLARTDRRTVPTRPSWVLCLETPKD